MVIKHLNSPACLPTIPSLAVVALALIAAQGSPVLAHGETSDSLEALRQDLELMRQQYERRIAELESRIIRLERAGGEAPVDGISGEREDLAALKAAARAAAGAAAAAAELPASAVAEPPVGHERNLNLLNPEISFTGDVLFLTEPSGRDEFQVREFELAFQTALDPYSFTKWFIAFGPEGEVDIEEGYASYTNLPGSMKLTAGKVRQSFGILNRWHEHALPQLEYPLALTAYFGEEGLAQTGLSLDWLLPRAWADANELTLQITNGENEAFDGELFDSFAILGHLKSYWDLNPATYFEWGLSGIAGETAMGGSSRVWGSDLSFHWQPPRRAKYREVTWRTELFLSERDRADGVRQEAWGLYSYLEGLLARNWSLGVRYDRAENPLDPDRLQEGWVPYLTWWQSEYVRLRAEYQHLTDRLTNDSDSRFVLQLTWAAGPHKHELY